MPRRNLRYRWADLPLDKATEMVARKTVSGARLTLSEFYFKMGALVPLHAHEGETMIYVLQGALRSAVDGETVTIQEGEVLVVPAGAPHHVEALEDTFVVAIGEGR